MASRTLRTYCALLALASSLAAAPNPNRLAYLNSPEACYFSSALPDQAGTQWLAEAVLGEVIILDLDRLGGKEDLVKGVVEQWNRGELGHQAIRARSGAVGPMRIVDVNGDGYLDLVVAAEPSPGTLVWSPLERSWQRVPFPLSLRASGAFVAPQAAGLCWGIVGPDHRTTLLVRTLGWSGAWQFQEGKWRETPELLSGLEVEGGRVLTRQGGHDYGVRLLDLDHDGSCELLVANPEQKAVFRWSEGERTWKLLPFKLPEGVLLADGNGGDTGLRFVDLDGDRQEDIVFSDESRYQVHLFRSPEKGWSKAIFAGHRSGSGREELPAISRRGESTGAWFDAARLSIEIPGWAFGVDEAGVDSPLKAALVRYRELTALMKDREGKPGWAIPRDRWKLLLAGVTNGFARLLQNEGESDNWFNYRGEKWPHHYIRQMKEGTLIEWETPRLISKAKEEPVRLVFAGAMGYASEPQTEGFELLVEGKERLRFDVAREPRFWETVNPRVSLLFFPTWISSVDAAGFFYLEIPRELVVPGAPCRLAVRSKGRGSRRWFALPPAPEAMLLQSFLQAAVED